MSSTVPTRPAVRGPYAKTARRQQEIIDAATSVFSARGYHGGSLRDISRELDLSLTSVVHHFPTKHDLLIAVLENADHTGADWLPTRIEEVGVWRGLSELVVTNYSRPELLRLFTVLSAEASAHDHPAHEWFVARYRRVSSEIARAIARDQELGRLHPSVDPSEAAKVIIAAWDGLQLQWLLDPTEGMGQRMEKVLSLALVGSTS